MQLLMFQVTAANNICSRYEIYLPKPTSSRRGGGVHVEEPFIQLVQSITGSGKTPMLAQAVADMRLLTKEQPLVLWISKGKVVVEQTTSNFRPGGKYDNLVSDFTIKPMDETLVTDVLNISESMIVTSTVAAFNRDVASREGLNVHRVNDDKGAISLWEALASRASQTPLFVVYDEGHNSTDKQIDLLLELHPKAIILASATMDVTPTLMEIAKNQGYSGQIETIKNNLDPVVTWVDTAQAVESELVKSSIYISGRSSLDEYVVTEMYNRFAMLQADGQNEVPPISPKCIYITTTNIVDSLNVQDDPSLPFNRRKARPIILWRILVEKLGVAPEKIAVYCDLRVKNPPKNFRLFRGGDRDYANFVRDNFEHIIFNQSLQEGWDDPECYFAYIDKDMGSRLQIKQVIGRVLRQPRAKYSTTADLNTAHFFIRFHSRQEFAEVLTEVQNDLKSQAPGIKVEGSYAGKTGESRVTLAPRKNISIPKLAADRTTAGEEMIKQLSKFPDYRHTVDDGRAQGEATEARIELRTGELDEHKWHTKGPGQRVIIGRYLRKKVQEYSPSAAEVLDLASVKRFSAEVELGSIACTVANDLAHKLSQIYEQHVEIVASDTDPYIVPAIQLKDDSKIAYTHSVHRFYSGLNSDEKALAKAIDKTGWLWARNPSQIGYYVPLPLTGPTRKFFPDFIVFIQNATGQNCIWLIDAKGGHLLGDALRNKLLNIKIPSKLPEIKVALIAKGKYGQDGKAESRTDGVTLYRPRSGNVLPEPFVDYDDCVAAFLGRKKRVSQSSKVSKTKSSLKKKSSPKSKLK